MEAVRLLAEGRGKATGYKDDTDGWLGFKDLADDAGYFKFSRRTKELVVH